MCPLIKFGQRKEKRADTDTRDLRIASPQVIPQETEQVTEQVNRLLSVILNKELGTRDLMTVLNLSHRPTFLYTYVQPALEKKLIEMTQPDSPNSPTQKYRLTEKGKR